MLVSAKPLTSSRFKRRQTQRSSSFQKFRTVHLGLRITVPRVLPRLRFSLLPQQLLEFLPTSGFFAYLYHICCSFHVICPFKIHHTPQAKRCTVSADVERSSKRPIRLRLHHF